MTLSEIIQSVSFSGHESFPLRFAWLTKAVRHLAGDTHLFGREDATVVLGVGKNMVRAIRHWALRSGMIEPHGESQRGGEYTPTPLGVALFGQDGLDPFLEEPATVWLVHWQLCSEPSHAYETRRSPTTWYWVFNELRDETLSLDELPDELLKFAERVGAKRLPSRDTVERDVACFVRSYVSAEPDKRTSKEDSYDSPLTDLSLLRREPESNRVVLDRGRRPTLTASVFAYAVWCFWQRVSPASETLSFEQIAYQATGPGQVFRLTENACVELLESMEEYTKGQLRFGRTSGVRQVLRSTSDLRATDLLLRGYGRRGRKEIARA
jgi:hypothetical protein